MSDRIQSMLHPSEVQRPRAPLQNTSQQRCTVEVPYQNMSRISIVLTSRVCQSRTIHQICLVGDPRPVRCDQVATCVHIPVLRLFQRHGMRKNIHLSTSSRAACGNPSRKLTRDGNKHGNGTHWPRERRRNNALTTYPSSSSSRRHG